MPFGWGANPNDDHQHLGPMRPTGVTNAFRLGG